MTIVSIIIIVLTLPMRSEMIPDAKTPQSKPKKVTCWVHFCLYSFSHTKPKSWKKSNLIWIFAPKMQFFYLNNCPFPEWSIEYKFGTGPDFGIVDRWQIRWIRCNRHDWIIVFWIQILPRKVINKTSWIIHILRNTQIFPDFGRNWHFRFAPKICLCP